METLYACTAHTHIAPGVEHVEFCCYFSLWTWWSQLSVGPLDTCTHRHTRIRSQSQSKHGSSEGILWIPKHAFAPSLRSKFEKWLKYLQNERCTLLSSFSLLFHRQGKLQGCGGKRYRFTVSWTAYESKSKEEKNSDNKTLWYQVHWFISIFRVICFSQWIY